MNSYLSLLSKDGYGSVADLEQKWDKAKKAAEDQGQGENYAYVTEIFQRMAGVNASVEQIEIGAAYRLLATKGV
jgi:hypothetical protein